MEPIKAPKVIKVYQLVRQTGLSLMPTGTSGTQQLGIGFYISQQEAEYNRTAEILKLSSGSKDRFHIFELELPNPAYENE